MPTIVVKAVDEKPSGRYVKRDIVTLLPELRAARAVVANRARWEAQTPEVRSEFQRNLYTILLIVAEAAILYFTTPRRR